MENSSTASTEDGNFYSNSEKKNFRTCERSSSTEPLVRQNSGISQFDTELYKTTSLSDRVDSEFTRGRSYKNSGKQSKYYESTTRDSDSQSLGSSSSTLLDRDNSWNRKTNSAPKDRPPLSPGSIEKLSNMFVTSYTRSKKSSSASSNKSIGPDFTGKKSSSLDMKNQNSSSNDSLQKRSSNVFNDVLGFQSGYESGDGPPAHFYVDENISQISELICIGNLQAVKNHHLLCKLGIDGFVNLSDTHVPFLVQSGKLYCNCACRQGELHFRSTLNIKLDNTDDESLEYLFSEINNFIETCNKKKKKILVFSRNGKSRAATAVIQYLMMCYNIPLRHAYDFVKYQRPIVSINAHFTNFLWKLNSKLNLDGQVLSLQDVKITLGYPKPAWPNS